MPCLWWGNKNAGLIFLKWSADAGHFFAFFNLQLAIIPCWLKADEGIVKIAGSHLVFKCSRIGLLQIVYFF